MSERNVADFKNNNYGNIFIDFLINTNMSMLNGRTSDRNDFTCISSLGCSVIDSCIVNHDDLAAFTDFAVTRASDMISRSGSLQSVAPSGVPDHSALTWNINLTLPQCQGDADGTSACGTYDKFDVSSVPDLFLSDNNVAQVNATIAELESSLSSQADIDSAYSEWCNIVTDNMYSDLQLKTITCGPRSNKKKVPVSHDGATHCLVYGIKCVKLSACGLDAMTALGKVNRNQSMSVTEKYLIEKYSGQKDFIGINFSVISLRK